MINMGMKRLLCFLGIHEWRYNCHVMQQYRQINVDPEDIVRAGMGAPIEVVKPLPALPPSRIPQIQSVRVYRWCGRCRAFEEIECALEQ